MASHNPVRKPLPSADDTGCLFNSPPITSPLNTAHQMSLTSLQPARARTQTHTHRPHTHNRPHTPRPPCDCATSAGCGAMAHLHSTRSTSWVDAWDAPPGPCSLRRNVAARRECAALSLRSRECSSSVARGAWQCTQADRHTCLTSIAT